MDINARAGFVILVLRRKQGGCIAFYVEWYLYFAASGQDSR